MILGASHFVLWHHGGLGSSQRVILGLQLVVLEGLPVGVSAGVGGALSHLSFPGGSLISFALQSHSAGCAVPLTR